VDVETDDEDEVYSEVIDVVLMELADSADLVLRGVSRTAVSVGDMVSGLKLEWPAWWQVGQSVSSMLIVVLVQPHLVVATAMYDEMPDSISLVRHLVGKLVTGETSE
jgi:hypothetical protein